MISPYKGLTPFTEDDRPYFFGRDAEREIIGANLKAARLTVLYGASGVGKTSVLRAGVLQDINELASQQARRGRQPDFIAAYCQDWHESAIGSIAAALRRAWAQISLELPQESKPGLRALLDSHSTASKSAVLLILDQFEEYLYYRGSGAAKETIDDALAEVLADRGLRVNILIALRDEALARLDQFKGRVSSLFDNYLRIDHLDLTAARDAILRPVKAFCDLQNLPPIQVESSLVEAILEQVRTGRLSFRESAPALPSPANSDRVEAPYLQLVLMKLWDEEMAAGSKVLRRDTLRRLGESSSIVKKHLDTTMDAFTEQERETGERVFFFLVTPSRTKIAHAVTDLAAFANLDEVRVSDLVTRLARPEQRILRAVPPLDPSSGLTRYEIYHDALADAILDWQQRFRARRREKQFKDEQSERERLERERRQRDLEVERNRRQRAIVAASIAVGLLCLGLAAWAYASARRAETAKEFAETERQRAVEGKDRIRQSLLIREAALSGDEARLSELLGSLRQSTTIHFGVAATDLRYRDLAGREMYRFRLYPERDSLPSGENTIALITYLADHPTFKNTLMTAGPQRDFAVTYEGWGCLRRITGFVEYADPEHPPTVTEFDGCPRQW